MKTLKIDKSVAIPPRGAPKGPRSISGKTAELMEVGDSVLCDTEQEMHGLRDALRGNLRRGVSVRKCADGGWRVWRIS